MKITRRGFVGSLGLGTAAGLISGQHLIGSSAFARSRAVADSAVDDSGIIRLSHNENPRGPSQRTLAVLHGNINKRLSRGYAPDYVSELHNTLAESYGIDRNNVLLATGSSPLLRGSSHAFCWEGAGLVTAAPSYNTTESATRQLGYPIDLVPVDRSMKLDLNSMAAVAAKKGAGLVYLCNPNNPTGTVHSGDAIETFVRNVLRESPNTVIHIDEAYFNYADPNVITTAVPLAMELENVFVSRSFSRIHGLAGLRVGYAVGREKTLNKLRAAWDMGDVSMLAAVAALTAHEDTEHLERERLENKRVRDFTVDNIRAMGYEIADSQTNYIFPDFRMPAREFRSRCLEQGVHVGDDFPPLEQSHCRISIGTMEEMESAIQVFQHVLTS